MSSGALQTMSPWAEDRAPQRCDPSADPVPKTGAGIGPDGPIPVSPFALPLRFWFQCVKPSRHDAATLWTGCPSPLANPGGREFQFTVNQYTASPVPESITVSKFPGKAVTPIEV
jgi:hypothetical protein